MHLNELTVKRLIRRALEEDLGLAGDITTDGLFTNEKGKAEIICKSTCTLAGIDIAQKVFLELEKDLLISKNSRDGDELVPGDTVMVITGKAGPILRAERTALNFLQHLSGISTNVRRLCQMVADLPVRLADTRKTTPGLRNLEKYAVAVGGGKNHRFGLFDLVLIKDNHLDVFGGIRAAIVRLRESVGHGVKIEVEVRNLSEVEEVLETGAEVIMLDNMSIEEMKKAVSVIGGRAVIEASGNITADNLRQVAETGVNVISMSALTKPTEMVDFSLRLKPL